MSTPLPGNGPRAFCRDCLADLEFAARRCSQCGSPRLVRHRALETLAIAHIDCDAFYATVEKRDNPDIADKPVIIGGGKRGVVSAACYISRTFGVRSAMPMFKALDLCPQAVVIGPDMAKYVRVGREVRQAMQALTPLVEPLSIDEAFLDLSGTQRVHGMIPAKVLARFAREVERNIGITVSVGLSVNKFLAKIASDLDKPRGFAVLGSAEAARFLAPKPVTFIFGVGKAAERRLMGDGYRILADLQRASETELMRRYGPEGSRLWRLARGIDARPVRADRETKSISAETTFESDIADFRQLEQHLWSLSERVSQRLKAKDLCGSTVTLKLKSADFHLRTRARGLTDPTALAVRIFAVARDLLAHEAGGTHYRLIGVALSDLVAGEQGDPGDLVDTRHERTAAAEHAVDRVRAKFGNAAIVRGLVFEGEEEAEDS